MSWLLLLPASVVLALYVLVFSLGRAAAKGDRMAHEAFSRSPAGWRNSVDGDRFVGPGWRT